MLFVNEKFLYRVVHHPHAQNQYWYLIHKGLPTQHKEHKFETHYCYQMVVCSCARLMSCFGVWPLLVSINLYIMSGKSEISFYLPNNFRFMCPAPSMFSPLAVTGSCLFSHVFIFQVSVQKSDKIYLLFNIRNVTSIQSYKSIRINFHTCLS